MVTDSTSLNDTEPVELKKFQETLVREDFDMEVVEPRGLAIVLGEGVPDSPNLPFSLPPILYLSPIVNGEAELRKTAGKPHEIKYHDPYR